MIILYVGSNVLGRLLVADALARRVFEPSPSVFRKTSANCESPEISPIICVDEVAKDETRV